MILTKDQVQKIIPHREPFLFIDNIIEINYATGSYDPENIVGNTVVGSYFTNPEHPIFEGHFPDKPILPGVCQTEMMAQISCFAAMDYNNFPCISTDKIALVMINNAKFRAPILPNSHLRIKAEIIRIRRSLYVAQSQVLNGDSLMSEAELTLSVAI